MKSISIFGRFSLLVAVVSLPFTIYIGATIYFGSQRSLEDAEENNRILAEFTASHLQRVMSDVLTLATELAKRPEIDKPGTPECNKVLSDFKQLHVGFLAASFNDEKGNVRCLSSSLTAPPPNISIADLEWFERVQAEERPVVSKPYFGRIQKRWLAITAAPVFDPTGRFKGSVVIPLDLRHLARGLDSTLTPGSFVLVVDSYGTVVARAPDFDKWVGKSLKDNELVDVAIRYGTGVARGQNAAGIDSLIGFATVPEFDWHVIVGGEAQQVMAPVRKQALASVAVGAGFIVATLIIAFAFAAPLIRSIRELASMTRTLAKGQFDVRLPELGATEIADLARDFNLMAASLHTAQSAQHESEKRFRQMFENNSTVLMLVDPSNGAIVDANESAGRFYGYSVERLKAMRIEQINDLPRDVLAAERVRVVREIHNDFVFPHRLASGELRMVEVHSTPINVGERILLFSIINDVTQRKLTEDLLRASEEHFRLALQNLPIVVFTQDREFRYTWIYNSHPGFSSMVVLGKRDEELLPAPEAARLAEIKHRVLENGAAVREEVRTTVDGRQYVYDLNVEPDYDKNRNLVGIKCASMDITARKRAEDEIRSLAFYDSLTGLPNRRLLLDRLRQAMAAGSRTKKEGALLFIDLDNFKTLNDTRGHDVGDLLLQEVGQRLTTSLRENDTVARLGGDEFVIMLKDLESNAVEAASQARTVGEKLLAKLNQPYQLAGYEHHATPSMGITLFGGEQEISIDELFKQADLAMYQAKADGRNTFRFFDPEMQNLVSAKAALDSDLRRAVWQEQFVLHYQAQVDSSGKVIGAEALVRWQHPQRGMVAPGEFIPVAEENGLILPIGNWVLETACRQLVDWEAEPALSHLSLAVNVSPKQFAVPQFVQEVLALVDLTGVDPRKLKLELTENLLLKNAADIVRKMNALKARGVGFSLDDFGTGYSSLAYLKRLPLAQLKIDQSFVRDILVDPNDAAIAQMIVTLAQSLGITVIAEGVEREEQRHMLADQGCNTYQGYLFSKPLPVHEFEAFVRRAS